MAKNNNQAGGFSLTEVLIAVLVLSIGLLGIGSLQLNSLRNNHSAYMRTQASALANDLIDRMRANRTAATSGSYDLTSATKTAPTAGTNCATTACGTTALAAYDLNDWVTRVIGVLPFAEVKVTRSANATTGQSDIVSVSIAWDDSRSGSVSETFLMSAQL